MVSDMLTKTAIYLKLKMCHIPLSLILPLQIYKLVFSPCYNKGKGTLYLFIRFYLLILFFLLGMTLVNLTLYELTSLLMTSDMGGIQDFGKGGGGAVRVTVKYYNVVYLRFFPLYEVWGSPKRGGGGVLTLRTPPPSPGSAPASDTLY